MADRPVDSFNSVLTLPEAPYVGRRVARPVEAVPAAPAAQTILDTGNVEKVLASLEPTDQTTSFERDTTAQLPMVSSPQVATAAAGGSGPGKRRAVKHAGRRGSLIKGLPSGPVVLGLATMAVAVFGTLTSTDTETVARQAAPAKIGAASALSGLGGVGTVGRRENPVSRDSSSQAKEDAAGQPLSDPAESLAKQRAGALANLARAAQSQAKKYAENQWVLPTQNYRLTATYGEYGLWASYHTGLDFAAPSGTPIFAVANGVITSTGYDGAYGNKTVLTLEDGTEIWFCHQTSFAVSAGDTVRAGQVIGSVGSTGNSTGPHLHLEVRPGGGDPVDPYAAMVQNGITP